MSNSSEIRRDTVEVFPNDNSPRLFKNKLLEYLTKTHPIIIDIMYLILGGSFIWYYYDNIAQNIQTIIGYFILGFFSWTFIEYVMHRWIYHKIKDATYNSGLQYILHGIHHKFPNDPSRLVLPPIPSLIVAFSLFSVFYFFLGQESFIFSPGIMMGYCAYMTIHYATHKTTAPNNIFSFWWNHHNIHHYQQHDRAFGVSSPLWDVVFGTMPKKGRKTVDILVKKK